MVCILIDPHGRAGNLSVDTDDVVIKCCTITIANKVGGDVDTPSTVVDLVPSESVAGNSSCNVAAYNMDDGLTDAIAALDEDGSGFCSIAMNIMDETSLDDSNESI